MVILQLSALFHWTTDEIESTDYKESLIVRFEKSKLTSFYESHVQDEIGVNILKIWLNVLDFNWCISKEQPLETKLHNGSFKLDGGDLI